MNTSTDPTVSAPDGTGSKEMRRKLLQTLSGMKQRCYNPNCTQFKNYGARGITICLRWLNSFDAFAEDMGERPPGMTIERINNDGNYEPSNCKWATKAEQRINQRSVHFIELDGVSKPLRHWAAAVGLTEQTLIGRLRRGWSPSKALHTPISSVRSRAGSLGNRVRWIAIAQAEGAGERR